MGELYLTSANNEGQKCPAVTPSVDTMRERFKFNMVDGMNKYIPKSRPSRTGTHKNSQPVLKL